MMDPETGDYRLIENLEAALRAEAEAKNELLLVGTEQQIEDLSRRVKLGNAELDRRARRRKQQRQSRKQNR